MMSETFFIIANFISPEEIGVNLRAMLWLLPLAAAIAIVYKATKVKKITTRYFLKEVAVLFGSIVVCIVASAIALYGLVWLIVE
ncbi:MAG: hypothetical protein KAQ89_05560 [Planctomycetes bacterium]|nr:hypothetical protein [Planctomycetota bacterium]